VKEGLGFEGLSIGANSLNRVTAGLVGLSEKRYISRNLQVSYDRVLRVGPLGPALFYYPSPSGSGQAQAPDRARPGQPNANWTSFDV
jgi:hypothetical protein